MVDKVLIVDVFLEILINASEVTVLDFGEVT